MNNEPKNSDKAKLEIRDGGGILNLIGAAVFVPGLFMMFANDGDPKVPPIVFKLISIPFLIAGAGILLARTTWIFDKTRDAIESRFGIIVPISTKKHGKLSEYRRVTMERVTTGKGKTLRYEHHVWLESDGPRVTRLQLMTNGGYKKTRAQIEKIARFLEITYFDKAG